MPTINPTITDPSGDGSTKKILWETLTYIDATPGPEAFDVGARYGAAQFADRTAHVSGTFGTGTVLIEGSNDGVNYATLNDPQGNPLTFVTERIESISEVTNFIRPRVSVGDEAMDVDIALIVRRANNMRT